MGTLRQPEPLPRPPECYLPGYENIAESFKIARFGTQQALEI